MNFATTPKLTEETSRLVRQVAHDIRSPLSVLSLIAGSDKVAMCEESRELVRAAIKRINDIAAELLANQEISLDHQAQARSSSGKVSIKSLVETVVSEKRILASSRNIEFKVIYQGTRTATLPDLGGKFERALSNLLDNALEAIVNRAGKIIISISESMGKVFLRITDNGKGIPQAVIARIGIEGFSYGKQKKVSGFGLGVYQAKAVAESIGGALKLYSLEGRGTTVLMELPATCEEA